MASRVYAELERVGRHQLRRHFGAEAEALTLDARALVHETFLKLISTPRDFDNRRHFYSFASQVMLRVLLDYAKARATSKRGGNRVQVTLSGLEAPGRNMATTVDDLVRALDRLERLDARKSEVVKLRTLWGLEMREISELLGTSLRTVERDWRFSRRWLAAKLRT